MESQSLIGVSTHDRCSSQNATEADAYHIFRSEDEIELHVSYFGLMLAACIIVVAQCLTVVLTPHDQRHVNPTNPNRF